MASKQLPDTHSSRLGFSMHPLSEEDAVAVVGLRSVVAPMKGELKEIAGRGLFNQIMECVTRQTYGDKRLEWKPAAIMGAF